MSAGLAQASMTHPRLTCSLQDTLSAHAPSSWLLWLEPWPWIQIQDHMGPVFSLLFESQSMFSQTYIPPSVQILREWQTVARAIRNNSPQSSPPHENPAVVRLWPSGNDAPCGAQKLHHHNYQIFVPLDFIQLRSSAFPLHLWTFQCSSHKCHFF